MATRFLLLAAATLLLLLSPTPTTCQSIVIPDVVLDLSGNPVEYGAEYYIIPVGGNLGGGLTRASKPHGSRCPLYAVQSPDNTDKGAAVKFEAVESTGTELFVGTNVRINSGRSLSCLSRGYWKVTGVGPTRGRNEIVAAGAHSIPPANFTLQPVNISPFPVYNIRYCFGCYDPDPMTIRIVSMVSVIQDNSGMRILGFPASNDVSRNLVVGLVKKTEANAVVFEY